MENLSRTYQYALGMKITKYKYCRTCDFIFHKRKIRSIKDSNKYALICGVIFFIALIIMEKLDSIISKPIFWLIVTLNFLNEWRRYKRDYYYLINDESYIKASKKVLDKYT